MSWIKTIAYKNADSNLKRIYNRVKGPENNVDNVLMIHSLRPHSLVGHMTLYKNVLHNSNNTLPKWYLEAIGVYVSYLNQCSYCVEHHFIGLKKLLEDDHKSERLMVAIKKEKLNNYFEDRWLTGVLYAKKLTTNHKNMEEQDVLKLRESGFSDGEILEINQVTSYFNYVNRTVLGLGVNTEGDILGLAPKEGNDPKNWKHN